jgi:hypothetical protein
MIQGYDNWKLDSPECLSEPDSPEEVVGGERGPFAWQIFCQTQKTEQCCRLGMENLQERAIHYASY